MRLEVAHLLILQEVRMGIAALRKLAAEAGYQVAHGEEVGGEILAAVLARQGSLSKVAAAARPTTAAGRWAANT